MNKVKSVFITGCSSGIGFASAKGLRDRGYHVVASCRRESDYERLIALGFDTVMLDLNNSSSIQQAAHNVLALCDNNLFALFNNAGFGVYGSIMNLSREALELQFSTNFFGMHELTRLLLPTMISKGDGRIIQSSSVMGFISTPGRGAYAASKYALEAWSDALRFELYNKGIKVCLIESGPIKTSFFANVNQIDQEHIVQNTPIAKRFALPAEAILPKLYHALEKNCPKIRYRVTMISHIAAILKRILPDKIMDMLLKKQ